MTSEMNAEERAWAQSLADNARSKKDRPVIKVSPGQLPQLTDQGEKAVLGASLPVYQYGNVLVRPGHAGVKLSDGTDALGSQLIPLSLPAAIEVLAIAADWQRFDERRKRWVPCDPPKRVAECWLARTGEWLTPTLAGLVQAPTLRPLGSVLEIPGFDDDSSLFLDAQKTCFPLVNQGLCREGAKTHIEPLLALLSEFPFVAEIDRSVAVSAVLTALIRPALLTAPLHAFTAPTPGSGKSYLVDVISMIVTGRRCPVMGHGKTDEEFEKRLGASLLAGDRVMSVDNVEQPLGGDLLCQALTQPLLEIRRLGHSVTSTVPSGTTYFATGNNIVLKGDLPRRALICRLDPGVERPEQRVFEGDPIRAVTEHRGRIATSCLAALRAYAREGWPGHQQLQPLGSFDRWSQMVRGCIVWLGLPDPVATQENIRESNPDIEILSQLFAHWQNRMGLNAYRAKELVQRAEGTTDLGFSRDWDLYYILQDVCANANQSLNVKRLGRWLARNEGRIVDDLMLKNVGITNGSVRWAVFP